MTESIKRQHGWVWHLSVLSNGFAAAFLLSTLHYRRADAYTTLSALLQFIGVLAVAKGIADLRGEVGLPSFLTKLRTELREQWRRLRGKHDVRQSNSLTPRP